MSKYLRSKKRVLDLCRLQGRLARRDYLQEEKNITRLETSREQIRVMAGQMLDSDGDVSSAILSAKLEFRHRLLKLDRLQKIKITERRKSVKALQSAAYLSARKEERAERDFRAASRFSENRAQDAIRIRSKKTSPDNEIIGKE